MQNFPNSSRYRVLLLTTTRSYRGPAFLAAARKLNIEIIQGIDMPQELATHWVDGLAIDFSRREESVQKIVAFAQDTALDGILAVDDSGTILAALASEALNLPHNAISAAEASSNKYIMRQLLSDAQLQIPAFQIHTTAENLAEIAQQISFPCVVKPLNLNGSRGVIRANSEQELLAAIKRCALLLSSLFGDDEAVPFLIETYIPGIEIALEGLMVDGRLRVLALYDKPDPLEGPFFEETIYVTPSRLPAATQSAIMNCAGKAARALGLVTGPIHAELRINEQGSWIIEIAGRSIGGLCSETLLFGINTSLEELILRQLCSLELNGIEQVKDARGVMMIPIPNAGLLRGVDGIEKAESIAYIERVEITAPINNPLQPVPEGDGYLGFIFATAQTPQEVENALREAHTKLDFHIDPLLPMITQY
ncbi:MAG: ATP-grasp domain-containing protein [Candidatus Promineifilaceae bacterium]|nr:ATP-grasp domain-containing protein [Candidatus Promineifilaceae bacterium]